MGTSAKGLTTQSMEKLSRKHWMTTFTGVVLVILILLAALAYMYRDQLIVSSYTLLGERAFGELSTDEEALPSRSGGAESAQSSYPIVADDFLYPEYSEAYEYVFDGELPDLGTIDTTVYRRVDELSIPASLSQAFGGLRIGDVSLSAFSGLELMNFSLRENDERGYNLYLDSTSSGMSRRLLGANRLRTSPYSV